MGAINSKLDVGDVNKYMVYDGILTHLFYHYAGAYG